MTTVETQERTEPPRSDLISHIHGVGLEVEKVRTEMAGLELRLVDQIGEVRGEVGEVRTEMAGLELRLVDQIGEVRGEVGEVRTEMAGLELRLMDEFGEVRGEATALESRLVDRMNALERRLSDRLENQVNMMRTDMAEFQRSLRGWLALGVSLMAVLVTLVALLG